MDAMGARADAEGGMKGSGLGGGSESEGRGRVGGARARAFATANTRDRFSTDHALLLGEEPKFWRSSIE
jgi:hypothetical protein